MFERFTDRARKTYNLANQNGQRLRHYHLGPEHLLLGLLQEGSGVGIQVLKEIHPDVRAIRADVEKEMKEGDNQVMSGMIPFSPDGNKIREVAIEISQSLGHNYIGTEHLILALIKLEGTLASKVLKRQGIEFTQAQNWVKFLLDGN